MEYSVFSTQFLCIQMVRKRNGDGAMVAKLLESTVNCGADCWTGKPKWMVRQEGWV